MWVDCFFGETCLPLAPVLVCAYFWGSTRPVWSIVSLRRAVISTEKPLGLRVAGTGAIVLQVALAGTSFAVTL